jgi:hypothetical protein
VCIYIIIIVRIKKLIIKMNNVPNVI